MSYYIASVKHTNPRDFYITFWRPNDSGYCWPLEWAGKYSIESVISNLDYYNNGHSTIAVHKSIVDEMAVEPLEGRTDGNAGPVVLNTKNAWQKIHAYAIRQPIEKPVYPYRKNRS